MKINISLFLFLVAWIYSCDYTAYPQGKALYEGQCAGCHGEDGMGFKDLYPPLKSSDYFAKDPYEVACIIVNGMEGEILVNGKSYDQPMQAIRGLSPVQITNILNYISAAWNDGGSSSLNIDLVKEKLKACEDASKVY